MPEYFSTGFGYKDPKKTARKLLSLPSQFEGKLFGKYNKLAEQATFMLLEVSLSLPKMNFTFWGMVLVYLRAVERRNSQ